MAVAKTPERNPLKYHRIMGIDSSSTGIAWTMVESGGVMYAQDKIKLDKIKNHGDKLEHIYLQFRELLKEHRPDAVFVEKSIFVKNPATARILSYVVGSLICVGRGEGYEVTDVEPATWKAWMGYTNLKAPFVNSVSEVLGKTEGKKFCDKLRKSQTYNVIKHNYPRYTENSAAETDHDIADSWGIALYGYDKLVEELRLEKSKAISLDGEGLAALGLSL